MFKLTLYVMGFKNMPFEVNVYHSSGECGTLYELYRIEPPPHFGLPWYIISVYHTSGDVGCCMQCREGTTITI